MRNLCSACAIRCVIRYHIALPTIVLVFTHVRGAWFVWQCYDPGECLLEQAISEHDLCARICVEEGDQLLYESDDPETIIAHKKKAAMTWYGAQKSVLIMSVLGDRELGEADKMQGGDYDGDCVIVIWDERIIKDLRPCEPLECHASQSQLLIHFRSTEYCRKYTVHRWLGQVLEAKAASCWA